jgi:hypothetical protein
MYGGQSGTDNPYDSMPYGYAGNDGQTTVKDDVRLNRELMIV